MDDDDYYSLDAVLADQQKVPSVFLQSHPDVAHLLTGDNETRALSAGAKLDLPLWMVRELATRGFVDIEVPKVFSERVRQNLVADASEVNLQRLCPYFYQFGMKVFLLRPEVALLAMLLNAFCVRLEKVADWSRNSFNKDMSSHIQRLDNTEQELFGLGKESAAAFQRWKDRKANLIKPSEALVSSNRKRSHNAL